MFTVIVEALKMTYVALHRYCLWL